MKNKFYFKKLFIFLYESGLKLHTLKRIRRLSNGKSRFFKPSFGRKTTHYKNIILTVVLSFLPFSYMTIAEEYYKTAKDTYSNTSFFLIANNHRIEEDHHHIGAEDHHSDQEMSKYSEEMRVTSKAEKKIEKGLVTMLFLILAVGMALLGFIGFFIVPLLLATEEEDLEGT